MEQFQLVGSGFAVFQLLMVLSGVFKKDWSLVEDELDNFTTGLILLLSVGFFIKIL